jgi:hypothetical protein
MHHDPNAARIVHAFKKAMDELKKHDRARRFTRGERSLLRRVVDKLRRKRC